MGGWYRGRLARGTLALAALGWGCRTGAVSSAPGAASGSAELAELVERYSAEARSGAGRMPDLSFDAVRQAADSARGWLQRLDRVGTAGLSHEEQLTLELLRWEAEKALQDTLLYWYRFDALPAISPMRAVVPRLAAHPLGSAAERQAYLKLLGETGAVLASLRDKMLAQASRGIVLAREQVDNVVTYHRSLMGADRERSFVPAEERLRALGDPERADFVAAAARVVDSTVTPALRTLVAYLDTDARRHAAAGVGLWQYPGGKEAYRVLVRRETTLNLTPEMIHELAHRQMEALETRMQAVRDSLGFRGTRVEFHEQLRRDRRFYVDTPDQVGQRLLAYTERIEPVMGRAFPFRQKAPYGVRRLDPALEPSMTYGYYNWATGSDPKGYYNFNGSDLDQRSLLLAGAIAFHELIPGHHFQISLQRESRELPPFRRAAMHAGYTEGWGEYSSSVVAAELGMYRDAYEVYGRLVFDAFFIARLVVDTGMNLFGWPRSRAIAYMKEHTLESDVQIDSETLRYSTRSPGQALAYRMGREAIVSLRARAERALGTRFDLRRFHSALLMSGSLPLFLLERHIDWWIERELAR